ncbi:isocitrate lyase/phosphoenolpyruvate mutase family protein [Halobellus sp. GM3]|uniref:isocitrate lyase/phosphoenolpyruvate mutase family protein n=1 Tax=Halobellus sp. GM3 TaxID=3458410 RepID=UPI00403D685B
MSARQRFRDILTNGEVTTAPIVHDAFTAKIAEEVDGFEMLGLSGYGISLSSLGLPDAGYITMDEMVENARNIANSVSLPVLADGDTGFGNALNARRTARELIQNTPVAGVFIEDQVAPKRCGHVAGKQIVSEEEAVKKLQAMIDVRDELDPDFVVMARTDARGAVNGSLELAIERANAYRDAGVDGIFVEGPTDEGEVREIGRSVDAPLMYNQIGVSPYIDEETLGEYGFSISAVLATMFPTAVHVYDHLQGLSEDGIAHEAAFQERIEDHPAADFHTLAGFDRVRELEAEFLPETAQDRYADSVGHVPGESDE